MERVGTYTSFMLVEWEQWGEIGTQLHCLGYSGGA